MFEYGKALKEQDRDGGKYPVFGSSGIVGSHSQHLGPEGPMIVVGRKGNAGAVHWSPTPGWPIDTAYWVRPRVSVNLAFLHLLLVSADLPSVSAQTGVPGLNRERAYELPVSIPRMQEQRRIVDLVSAASPVASAAARLVSTSDTLEGALLADLVSSLSGDPGPTLESVCTVVDCEHKTAPEDRSGPAWSIGTPALRLGRIDFDAAKAISLETWVAWTRRLQPKAGDLILAREAPVGAVALVPAEKRVALGQRTVLLRVKPEQVEPAYLHAILRGSVVQETLHALARGLTVPHLNVADVRTLRLPPLPPVSEQREQIKALEALAVVRARAMALGSATALVQRGLIQDLLGRRHLIPESYDRLLEAK